MYVAVKGRREGDPRRSRLTGTETTGRWTASRTERRTDRRPAQPGGGPGDDRGRHRRPRTGGAGAGSRASGDNVEAIFLLRAYRTTLPRLAVSEPINTAEMRLERRISAVYKDIPRRPAAGPHSTTTPTACSILPCWPTAKRRLCSKPMAKQSRRRTSLACSRSRAGEDRGRSRHAARRYHPHPAGLPLLAFLAPAAADARR